MRTLLLLAAIVAVSQAQTDCSQGACYPPINDLLLGRAHQLHASSTCGLTGSEVYCTPYQQRRMKCCPCDSRNPNGQLAHTVQEVLSTSGPDRWWQSRKELSPVTLQLDLNNLFQLDNLVLSFKGPRPSVFVIERTLDNGRTWQPALYLATDCQKAFPGIPTTTPLTLDQTYCYTLPPTGVNPYQDHTIQFSPLRQYAYVPAPNSQKIEYVSGLTGLRVRLTELGDVPHLPGRALSRFYALKEMRVMGSCMCHGHANQCLPEVYNNPLSNSIQVNPQCDCQHNTAGVNCERCADLYNDLPWRPAEEGNTHTCKRCECNNHAQRCHFDQAVYEASGRRSGGVCEGCMHHTTGPKCDQCAPGYQPNPRSRMDRPDACTRCICSAEGTLNGGRCDDSTGSCQCKVNVEGPRCDRCKRGYYGLSASNPLGCSRCSCSPDGSLSDLCDPVTGQCPCRPHFHGLTCEVCSQGYWNPFLSGSCEPCGCDPSRSFSDNCDQVTGQCHCRPSFGGRTCTECPDKTYGDPLIGCQPCRCDAEGTLPEVCDKQTGVCLCRPGITGARCDSCSRGHCDSFPACETCPSCFFTLDAQRQNLSLVLERLSFSFPSTGDLENVLPSIRNLEDRLSLIRNSVSLPPSTARQIDNALSQLYKLRDQVNEVNNDLSPLVKTPGLDSELDKLQALLVRLTLEYKIKKDAMENTNNAEGFSAIQKAYNESTDAAKKVDDSRNTVKESANAREQTEDLQNQIQPANTRDLDKLNESMASRPDLTPVAKQVCGSVRSEPCTPLQCDGLELCPPKGTPPCKKGEKCVGALPLSKRADADAKDVKDRLDKLTGKITEAAEKLQETQETTNQVRQSAEKLFNTMKQTRDELEEDLKETRDVVKALKDFLSDPSSNLTHVQEVSDWILKAKPPLSLVALKRKLEDLKNLAANLPNSTAVLDKAKPQLDKARKLLQEAQDARDTALGVKADVDGLLAGFGLAEGSLSDLEDKLQNSMDLLDNLNNSLTKAKDQLSPAEKALDDVSTLIKPMKPQLDELKDLLQNGGQQAQDAQENADKAEDEAATANEDLLSLEKQLDRLKDEAAAREPGEEAGPVGERLATLQQDAGALANTTENMMKALEGKADSLRFLQNEILQKSTKLEGLDAKLKDLVAKLRKKANDLSTCQG
ncbi:laminin subunit beta-3 isoform X1 [Siniperca chuatsi]|uniref:laminin subunit beta-3 isoform X1 n=2 Tax=Siniperca chuatsi TaxID=119488 RepID=UPI001CE07F86|nr:laminin subunit beta-3 isoform X1 [Siniperca chuatsi]XP_044068551.1 laminin subunit beta-3 isoform X1 [Siniperca chuatsi]